MTQPTTDGTYQTYTTQPTTQAEKYSPEVLAAQADARLATKQETIKVLTDWALEAGGKNEKLAAEVRHLRAGVERQRELTQAAGDLADDMQAAFEKQRTQAFALSDRLVRIRNIATVALYDTERMHIAALADALAEILTIAKGDK